MNIFVDDIGFIEQWLMENDEDKSYSSEIQKMLKEL